MNSRACAPHGLLPPRSTFARGAGQRQLEAALRGYRLGYRATGYRRQNVAFGVYQAVNRRLLTASFDAYRLAYRALRTSSMLAYAGPKLKFSEVAGSRARVRRRTSVLRLFVLLLRPRCLRVGKANMRGSIFSRAFLGRMRVEKGWISNLAPQSWLDFKSDQAESS